MIWQDLGGELASILSQDTRGKVGWMVQRLKEASVLYSKMFVILSHKHYLSNPDVAVAKIRYDPTSPGRILCL